MGQAFLAVLQLNLERWLEMKVKRVRLLVWIIAVLTSLVSGDRTIAVGQAEKQHQDVSFLMGACELAGPRSKQERYYRMESIVVHRETDGTKKGQISYKLLLQIIPGSDPGGSDDTYTCRCFTVQREGEAPVLIQELSGFAYVYQEGVDEEGQIFGLDQSRFQFLSERIGIDLSVEEAYFVFNTFVDFHTFLNVLSTGESISVLKRVGDHTSHSSSFSTPPLHLGDMVQEGSVFNSGELWLRFDGYGLAGERPCALVRYDGGDSFFKMNMVPAPNILVEVNGYSHYRGMMWIDVEHRWIERVELGEVISTRTSMADNPVDQAITLRTSVIESLSESDFNRLLTQRLVSRDGNSQSGLNALAGSMLAAR